MEQGRLDFRGCEVGMPDDMMAPAAHDDYDPPHTQTELVLQSVWRSRIPEMLSLGMVPLCFGVWVDAAVPLEPIMPSP